eukprot:9189709-Pyramimonas_sp.AAC.1
MLEVMPYLLTDYFPMATDRDTMRYDMVTALCRVYESLKNYDPAQSHVEISRAAHQHLALYREFHRISLIHVCPYGTFYRWYPKHHLFLHCCTDQQNLFGSASSYWAYADESEIGQCSDMAEFCKPVAITTSLLEKYRGSHF